MPRASLLLPIPPRPLGSVRPCTPCIRRGLRAPCVPCECNIGIPGVVGQHVRDHELALIVHDHTLGEVQLSLPNILTCTCTCMNQSCTRKGAPMAKWWCGMGIAPLNPFELYARGCANATRARRTCTAAKTAKHRCQSKTKHLLEPTMPSNRRLACSLRSR